jgi:hypothetical protein
MYKNLVEKCLKIEKGKSKSFVLIFWFTRKKVHNLLTQLAINTRENVLFDANYFGTWLKITCK